MRNSSDCILLIQTDSPPSCKKYYMFETLEETLSCVLTNCESLIKIKSEEPLQKFKYSIKMLFDVIDEIIDLAIMRYNPEKDAYDYFDKEWVKKILYQHIERNSVRPQ